MKIYYRLLLSAALLFLLSCRKGTPEQSIYYSNVFFYNVTGGLTLTAAVDGGGPTAIPTDGASIKMTAGDHKVIFTDGKQPLLDTTLNVPLVGGSPAAVFTLFRTGENAPLRLWDIKFLGIDTVPAPPSGFFTINIANFAATLPDTVDAHFLTDTWLNGVKQTVEAGALYGVNSTSFSAFTSVLIGKGQVGNSPQDVYTVNITRAGSREILYSDTYKINIGNVITHDPAKFIYTAYLKGNGTLQTLLEK